MAIAIRVVMGAVIYIPLKVWYVYILRQFAIEGKEEETQI